MDAFDDLETQLHSLNSIVETNEKQKQQQQQQQHPAVPQIQYLNKATGMLQQSLEKGDGAAVDRYRTACHAAINNLRELQKQGVPPEIDAHIKQAFAQVKPLIVQIQQQQSVYASSPYSSPLSSPASSPQSSPNRSFDSSFNSSPNVAHSSPSSTVLSPPNGSQFSSSSGQLLAPPTSPKRGGSPRRQRKSKRMEAQKKQASTNDLARSAGIKGSAKSVPQVVPSYSSFEDSKKKKSAGSSGTLRGKKGKKSLNLEGLDVGQKSDSDEEDNTGYLTPKGKTSNAPISSRISKVGKSSLRYDSYDEEKREGEEEEEEEEDEEFSPDPMHPIFPEGCENAEEAFAEEVKEEEKGPKIFRALYWHRPPKDEWLTFEQGEIITALPCSPSEEMLGWEKGVSGSTGKVGMFPVAYVEKMDPSQAPKQPQLSAPPAVIDDAEASRIQSKRVARRRQPRSSNMRNYAHRGDLEKRASMGINADKRASMLISHEIVKQMNFGGKKEKKEKAAEKEEKIPECLLFDKKEHEVITPSIRKPSGDKEKKKQKGEIDAIISRIARNDASVFKVDFSDIKLPYSALKKLFAAIGKNKKMYSLKLANCGLIASHCQLLEVNLTKNLALKELDLSRNGFGLKEAKILETTVQKCFCLVKLAIFSPDELGKKKDLATAQQNIDWYLQSNVGFLEFIANRSTELRLCGRALSSTLGWERYDQTTLLNASHNYLKDVNPKIGNVMTHLTELNLSHNDISAIPYSFGQLASLTTLNISFNQIKEIPSSLDQCTKLEILHAENNKIRSFPSGILKISTLKEVHAQNNKAKIPKDMDPSEQIQFLLEKYSKC